MTFAITRLVDADRGSVEITEEEYDAIRGAKAGLLLALGLEERFNLVLENYADFEGQLLVKGLRMTLFADDDWSSLQGQIYDVNRLLLNVLSAARLYLDHLPHTLASVYGSESGQVTDVVAETNRQYDSVLGYRVMEALRNHLQHRDLPIQNLSMEVSIRGGEAEGSLVPRLIVQQLRKAGKFKASVLEELEAGDERTNLKPLLRDYVASVTSVHQKVRGVMEGEVQTWGQTFTSTRERYIAAHGPTTLGLAVARLGAGGAVEESDFVIDELVRRREWLTRKNSRKSTLRHVKLTSGSPLDEKHAG